MTASSVFDRASQAFARGWPASEREQAGIRFDKHGSRLEDCLRRLYGERPDFEGWFIGFCRSLGHRGGQRPDDLKALDRRRERQPDWFLRDRLVGYSAYVDRFGGTLRGVGERIGYLSSLGVGYLHLLPFLRSREGENDGGFAVSRFDQVEPALGDIEDLRSLTARLREAGISLCADFVLNHVADDHPWAVAARQGDPEARRCFHVLDTREQVQAYEASLGQVFPEVAPGNFTRVEAMQAWVWTTFYPYQWDLNYAEPRVFASMADVLLQLANHGVEVFRLDSVPYLWKRMGAACVNEPEVHQVVGALRAVTELVAPACLLKAEAITPTEKLVPYFGQDDLHGRECHLAYQSSLMASAWASLAEGSAELVRNVLASMRDLPPDTGWMTYVRCHDDIVWGVLRADIEKAGGDYASRIGAVARTIEGREPASFGRGAPFQYAEGEVVHGSNGMTATLLGLPEDPLREPDPNALSRLALMYGLSYWMGAVPMIYMGDEMGQGNNTDTRDAALVAADGRWLQRPRLDPLRLELRDQQRGVPGALRVLFDALRAARAGLPLRDPVAPRVEPAADPAVLVLAHGYNEKAWFNFSGREARVDLPGPGWRTMFAGLHEDGTLPAWGMHWSCRA